MLGFLAFVVAIAVDVSRKLRGLPLRADWTWG